MKYTHTKSKPISKNKFDPIRDEEGDIATTPFEIWKNGNLIAFLTPDYCAYTTRVNSNVRPELNEWDRDLNLHQSMMGYMVAMTRVVVNNEAEKWSLGGAKT